MERRSGSTTTAGEIRDPQRTDRTLRAIAERAGRSRGALPAPQVLVRAPGLEFASGDRARRFHAASVAKMMTATLAFQLAEGGGLDLGAALPGLLPADEIAGLYERGGTDMAAHVTPLQLLTHTSGVADVFEGRNDTGRGFVAHLVSDRSRRYEPADLLAITRDHQQPVGAPGERFHSSDTGYVLLGRIIEEAGGASLGDQLHHRVLGPAGMDDSCPMFRTMPGGAASVAEPGEELDIAPIVVDGMDLSRAPALSCDWGGGGVVTTLDDLQRFADAWRTGELVGAASRDRMARFEHRHRPGIRGGAGLMQLLYPGFFPLLLGLPRPVGHLGVTAVHLFLDPGRGITLALNAHSTTEMASSFGLHIRLLQTIVRAQG